MGRQAQLSVFSYDPMDGLEGYLYLLQFMHHQYAFLNL